MKYTQTRFFAREKAKDSKNTFKALLSSKFCNFFPIAKILLTLLVSQSYSPLTPPQPWSPLSHVCLPPLFFLPSLAPRQKEDKIVVPSSLGMVFCPSQISSGDLILLAVFPKRPWQIWIYQEEVKKMMTRVYAMIYEIKWRGLSQLRRELWGIW